jgi:hypothetical protein
MTNDELLNNSQPEWIVKLDNPIYIKRGNIKVSTKEIKLPYHKTEWGLFYTDYKELNQLQLQKRLEKTINELTKTKKMCKYDIVKWVQHIFYKTEYDKKTDTLKTPEILLRHAKRGSLDKEGCVSQEWSDDVNRTTDITSSVFKAYKIRCVAEYKEVKEFYEARKIELETEQKVAHKKHANELVSCPFCQCQIARTGLARHKKTNKKCLSTQI